MPSLERKGEISSVSISENLAAPKNTRLIASDGLEIDRQKRLQNLCTLFIATLYPVVTKDKSNYNYSDLSYDFSPRSNVYHDVFECVFQEFAEQGLPVPNFVNIYGCYPSSNLFKRFLKRVLAQYHKPTMVKWLSSNQGYRTNYDKVEGAINAWVTFENFRPPHNNFDLTFSFDTDAFGTQNIYFPLLFRYVEFFNSKMISDYAKASFETLTSRRELDAKEVKAQEEKKFACAFINNPETTRLRAIDELRKIGPVDVYGRINGNYVKDKIAVAQQYQFQICFENDLYPGYITEKPLEAWLAKNIPIYSGIDSMGILNQRAILNLHSFQSLSDLKFEVERLHSNPVQQLEIISQPLLCLNYNLKQITEKIKSALHGRPS